MARAARSKAKAAEPQTLSADILVIGGGLAGLTMATLLGSTGFRCIIVDRLSREDQLNPAYDRRTTAVAYGPRTTLEAAGVWQHMGGAMSPIREIRITDEGSPATLHFDHKEVGDQPFGHIVDNIDLRRAQFDRLDQLTDTVTHLAPAEVVELQVATAGATATLSDGRTLKASLVIGADGRKSFVRESSGIKTRGWAYGQTAVIGLLAHEFPHNGVALEHFTATGPFAILPMTDTEAPPKPGLVHRSALVWSRPPEMAERLLAMEDADFAASLAPFTQDWLGELLPATARAAYPLSVLHADKYVAPRIALIGEAAHAMHPIAGQGLNVSLRDVQCLADLLAQGARLGQDPGAPDVLARYQRKRRPDVISMLAATDGLCRLFSNRIGPVAAARDFGLGLVGKLPPVKSYFMRHAMGLTSRMARAG